MLERYILFLISVLITSGPQRSLIVHVSCGLNNQISNVREPNKCEYHMDFVTPAVCIEEKVTETLKDEI